SCLRVRVRSRNAWIGAGGTKLARISPWASRSASQSASVTSLLRPGTLRTAAALASTSSQRPSSTCQTVRSLHRDGAAPARRQPIRERAQPGRRRGEGRDVTDDACPLLYAGTRHHGLIVHVQRSAPRVETLHRRRPPDCPAAAWSRYVEVYETCSRVQTRGDSPRGSRAPVKLHSGLLDATRHHDLRAAAEA